MSPPISMGFLEPVMSGDQSRENADLICFLVIVLARPNGIPVLTGYRATTKSFGDLKPTKYFESFSCVQLKFEFKNLNL